MPLPSLLVCFLLMFEVIRNWGVCYYMPTSSNSCVIFPLLSCTLLELEKVIHDNQPGVLVHSSHQGCIPFLGNHLTGQTLLSRSCDLVISLFSPLMILNSTYPKTFAAKAVSQIQFLCRSSCLSIRSTWELLFVDALITCIRSCHQSTPEVFWFACVFLQVLPQD